MVRWLITCVLLFASAPEVFGQTRVPEWITTLGERADAVLRNIPVVDRVVLVPDEATYLDEVSRWSHDGHWPVLFDETHFAPIFVRAFQPKEVLVRESVGRAGQVTRDRVMEAVAGVWGAKGESSLPKVFETLNHTPAGVVVTSADDSAWPAAVALAGARGQPVIWLDEKFGRVNQTMTADEANRLLNALHRELKALDYEFEGIGDTIDAITICRQFPCRVDFGGQGQPNILALTDVIGRNFDHSRFAVTGWIFGTHEYAAYAAMSSLFLSRESAWCVDTYETPGSYSLADAAVVLSQGGLSNSLATDARASQAGWLEQIAGGIRADLVFVNTQGNSAWFQMRDGERCYAVDIPVLTYPTVVHFIHSFSASKPDAENNLSAEWFRHGAYAYVGSVDEPTLSGFEQTSSVVARLLAGGPFLASARKASGPPWKINTHGDPLMTLGPERRRIEIPRRDGIELRSEFQSLSRTARSRRDGDTFARAMKLADLLGEDASGVDLWELAVRKNLAPACAREALAILFRTRRHEDFMTAWFLIGSADDRQKDMLWHLMLPRLGGIRDNNVLLALQSNLRGSLTHVDIGRLAPALQAAFGPGYVRDLIRNELRKRNSVQNERELKKLQRTFR